jgi:hypothetical protein
VKSLLTQHFPIPRPAPHGGPTTFAVHFEHYSDPDPGAILVDALRGRGLYSSTFQLNLSRSCY